MVWSPRWYDYTMACAPPGKEGVFGALALMPIFAAKLPTGLLGGYLLQTHCPAAPGGDCVDGGGVRDAPCDGRALWGIIGLVTLTSPLLIAVFHRWLRDSGDGDGDAIHGPGGAMKYEELDPIGIEEREAVDDDSDGDDPKIELVDMAKPSSEAAV
jgi:hypothetical protein